MFTVGIIDDQPATLAGLVEMVSNAPGFVVVSQSDAAADLADGEPPDVVLVRLEVLAESESAYVTAIEKLAHRCRVVVTSSWDRPLTVLSVVRAGANGCLTRFCDPEIIISAVSTAAHGGLYVCPDLAPLLQAELSGARGASAELAPREVETLTLIALGLTHTQIARRMGLAPATVNTYAKRLRAKLRAGNKAELTRRAVELGHLDHVEVLDAEPIQDHWRTPQR
jgi:DNA-binding NarL/FixJ family response regulator